MTVIAKIGDKGQEVKVIQEFLCLRGFHLMIDGDFGPATKRRVEDFQGAPNRRFNRLPVTGEVDDLTYCALINDLTRATKLPHTTLSLGLTIAHNAKRHLKFHPKEVGGQNRGPWVRFYMNGYEGDEFPWCAGFVSKIVIQSFMAHGRPLPDFFPDTTFSCDEIAIRARNHNNLIPGEHFADKGLFIGSIFLVRKTPIDWVHTGVVTDAGEDFFYTIEGNTNDEGHREGYEVCERVRGYGNKDFIIL